VTYGLRPITINDFPWLWALKLSTMKAYVEQTWGRWDDREQKHYFYESIRATEARVITIPVSGNAGLLDLRRRGSELFLQRIEIKAEFQRLGIGTAILRDIQAESRSVKKPVRLQVLRVNPARQLYLRLGFVEEGETETHALMSWYP
jgi:ribosomal protein S18 acetylase RimI-like enzyme